MKPTSKLGCRSARSLECSGFWFQILAGVSESPHERKAIGPSSLMANQFSGGDFR